MMRTFRIDETVTGFSDGDVQLEGTFRWDFDARNESYISANAINLTLSRDQYLATTGVLYRFSYDIQDSSERGVLETKVGASDGLRDTIHIVVRLLSKHNDGHGLVNTVLGTAELRESGNRYFVPPLSAQDSNLV